MTNNFDLSFCIEHVEISVKRVPVEVPVQTSFGIMQDRPAVFVLARDVHGNKGSGEVWCNFPTCGAEHRANLLKTTILPTLLNKTFGDPQSCFEVMHKHFEKLSIQTGEFGPIAQCLAGLDVAIWDLVARRADVPLYHLLGGTSPKIDVYTSGINPTGAVENVRRMRGAGHTAFKLKIGFGAEIDDPNVEQISAELGAGERFMVDANQAWSLSDAQKNAARLARYPISWLEEPMLATTPNESWQALAQSVKIPLAAGENLTSQASFQDAINGDWLTFIQPDVCKWGGISRCLPIAQSALNAGKVMCPHFLGAGIGLAASAHLLAAVGGPGMLEIDSNPNALRDDYFAPSVSDGAITLGDEPGLGIAFQPSLTAD